MVRGLGLDRRGGGRLAAILLLWLLLLLLVLLVKVIVPERGSLCCGSSGRRRRARRRELTVCVRALGRAEGVFTEHVRSLGRFRAVVVGFGRRLLVIIVIVVVVVVLVIVITVTVITRASRLENTVICTRGFVVEILVIIPRRCRWGRRCGGCCCCGGGGGCCRCGGARGRRATRRFIKLFLLYRLVVVV